MHSLPKQGLTEGGTISGVVYDSSGTPLADSWIWVEEFYSGNYIDNVDTAVDGSYSFTGLPTGDYRVFAEGVNHAHEIYNDHVAYPFYFHNADIVSVVQGNETPNIDFYLDDAAEILVTVYADDGVTPLSGIPVDTYPGGFGDCTDETGEVYLTGLPLNTDIYIHAGGQQWGGCPNQDYADLFYGDVPDKNSATPIVLTAQGQTYNADINLYIGGTISGTVTDQSTGQPLENIVVDLSFDGYGIGTCTDANGDYSFNGLAYGVDFRMQARTGDNWCGGPTDYIREYWEETPNYNDAFVFNLNPISYTYSNIDFTLEQGGSVSGHVYDEFGNPIQNAQIIVETYDWNWLGDAWTLSDGSYTVAGIATGGPYRVKAQVNGYAFTFYDGLVAYPSNFDDATGVNVTAGADTSGIDFYLQEGGNIEVRVYADDGVTPLAGVPVDTSPGGFGRCTDQYGVAMMENLPLNTNIVVRAGGPQWGGCSTLDREEQYSGGVTNEGDATPNTLTYGGETQYISFSLGTTGSISGTVVDSITGQPIENIAVSWGLQFNNEYANFPICSDGSGNFTLLGIPLNTDIYIFADPSRQECAFNPNYAGEYYQDAYAFDNATPLQASDATPDIGGYVLELDAAGSISGVITDEQTGQPIENMSLWVFTTTEWTLGTPYWACTDANGYYEFNQLPLGYEYEVNAPGFHNFCGGPDNYVKEYYDNTLIDTEATYVPLTTGSPTATNIDFVLQAGGYIEGYVTDNTDNPLVDIKVVANGDGYGFMACTDETGYYQLNGMPLNTDLIIEADSDNKCGDAQPDGWVSEYWQEAQSNQNATPIQLTSAGQVISGINFTLEPGGSLTGTVVADEDGTPLEGVWLCSFDYNATAFDLGHNWNCGQTDVNGQYTLYDLPVGLERVWIFPQDRLRLFYSNSTTYDGATAVPVTAGQTAQYIDFSLPLATVITGTVYDSDGVTPLQGVTISTDANEYPECSQADGTYRIFVPVGNHIIKASSGMCSSTVDFPTQYYDGATNTGDAMSINVTDTGQTITGIDFTLVTGGSLSGVIYQPDGTTPEPAMKVELISIDYSNQQSTCTDGNGYYSFDGIGTGEYFIRTGGFVTGACAGGDDSYATLYYGNTYTERSASTINVDPGNTTFVVDMTLEPGVVVSGSVYADGTNDPLEGMQVRIESRSTTDFHVGTCTNTDGSYAVYGLPLNRDFFVQSGADFTGCSNPEGNYAFENYDDQLDPELAQVFNASDSTPITGINFWLAQAGTISGTVTEALGGAPVANVLVDVDAEAGFHISTTCTDENGEYTIWGILYGLDFTAKIDNNERHTCGNQINYAYEAYNNSNSYNGRTVLQVNGITPNLTSIDFSLDPGGIIEGQVVVEGTGDPLHGFRVNAWSGSGAGGSTCTEVDGTYRIYSLSLFEDYAVVAQPDPWCPGYDASDELYTQEYWDNAPDTDSATLVSLTDMTPNVDQINFEMGQGGSISGFVYDSLGNPLENAQVIVETFDWQWQGDAYTASDGSYTVSGLTNGDYRVKVQADRTALTFYDGLVAYPADFNDATPVNVTGGNDTSGIDFYLQEGGTLEVTVYADDGVTPLEGVHVDTYPGGFGQCTDQYGIAHLTYLPLNTDIIVKVGGTQWGGCPTTDRVMQFSGGYYHQDEAIPNVLTTVGELQSLVFMLGPSGSVSGIVIDEETSQGIGNLNIRIQPVVAPDALTQEISNVCTNEDGTFTFGNLPMDVTYNIIAPYGPFNWCQGGSSPGYLQEYYEDQTDVLNATPIVLDALSNPIEGIQINLNSGGSVSGNVSDQSTGLPIANVPVNIDYDGYSDGLCTDENGNYTITGIPLGTDFTVRASSIGNWCGGPDYYGTEYWQETQNPNDAVVFNLTAGSEDVTNIDFTLQEAGIVRGTVTDATTGDYRVFADANQYAKEVYNNLDALGLDYMTADRVSVVQGADTSGINFSLAEGGNIQVAVYASDGITPLAGVPVDTYPGGFGQCTDENGIATIYSLSINTDIVLQVGGVQWGGCPNTDYVKQYSGGVLNANNATPNTLTFGGDSVGLTFNLDLAGSISGHVEASEDQTPLDGIWLCAFDFNATAFDLGYNWSCASTDVNGDYTIGGVPAGDTRVWIFPQDRLRLYYNQSLSFDGATAVNVIGGQTTTGIDFSLPQASLITGMVYDEDGVTPLQGVTISTANGDYMECSQEDGSYRIFVPAGTHVVKAETGVCSSTIDFPTQYYDSVTSEGAATGVVVNTTGETITNIDFVKGSAVADVTAPVITLNGSDPVDVLVNTVYIDAGATATDDVDGSVNVDVDISSVLTGTVGSYIVNYSATDSSGNTGYAIRTVNVYDLSIIGTIQNQGGLPITDIEVTVTDSDAYTESICTDVNGDYEFTRSQHGLPQAVLTVSSGGSSAGTNCGDPNNDDFEVLQLTADLTSSRDLIINLGLSLAEQPVVAQPAITAPPSQTTDSTPDLVWTEVANATAYRILLYNGGVKEIDTVVDSSSCTASICTYTVPSTLTSASYDLYVRGQNSISNGPWSTVYRFIIGLYGAPPTSAPTITAPPSLTGETSPEIIWDELSDASDYRILLYNSTGKVHDTVVNKSLCITGTCTYVISNTLQPDNYILYMYGINPLGNGPTTSPYTFQISLYSAPPQSAPTITAPSSITIDTTPDLVWNELSDADSYRVLVYGPSGLVWDNIVSNSACDTGVCTVTIPVTLQTGNHNLFVQGRNPLGIGPWSNPRVFEVSLYSAPPQTAPTITAPSSITIDTTPDLVWNELSDADSYRVLVYGPSGLVWDTVVTKANVCNAGVCSVTTPVSLQTGNHNLYVRGQNPLDVGPWSNPKLFNVSLYSAPPQTAPTITAPSSLTTNTSPDLVWNEVSDADRYRVLLYGPSGKIVDTTVTKATVCNAGVCTLTTPTTLQYGRYTLYIQPQNPLGTGPYTSAYPFEVSLYSAAPASPPTITAPGNPTADNTPDLVWNELADANQYRILLYGSGGKLLDHTASSSVCNAGVCTYTVPFTLSDGAFSLYIRGQNPLGAGAWKYYSFIVDTTP